MGCSIGVVRKDSAVFRPPPAPLGHAAPPPVAPDLPPGPRRGYLAIPAKRPERRSGGQHAVDDWGVAGLPLEKEASTSAAKAPTIYPAHLRFENHDALYPKVYVASGKALPAKLPEGKVVHVPYTELLNDNGTPKAAKDLWTILTKAGVPRYAEIVSVSDDPGEAAATYFILKLMGYPDVKVPAS